jgi:hypothetical protein
MPFTVVSTVDHRLTLDSPRITSYQVFHSAAYKLEIELPAGRDDPIDRVMIPRWDGHRQRPADCSIGLRGMKLKIAV